MIVSDLASPLIFGGIFLALYFEVFMLTSFLQAMYERKRSGMGESSSRHQMSPGHQISAADLPSVSVIVPCWNEEKTLGATMESLLALDYPREKLKFIIVDDGSTDNTLKIARTFEFDTRITVLHKENGGKHSAMNFALARVDTELVGCLDADSTVAPDALLYLIPGFKNNKVAAVTSGIVTKKPENIIQHVQHAEYRIGIFYRFTLATINALFIAPGPFSIFRTDIIKNMGGWRYAHSTEDLEITLRLHEAGYLVENAPLAIVYTGTPRTVRALVRQRVRWTYGFLRNAVDFRHMFANTKYGVLSLFILPINLISIGVALIFFINILYGFISLAIHWLTYYRIVGVHVTIPSFSWFYFDTSMMFFLGLMSVGFILMSISLGTQLSYGSRRPPLGTMFFIALYGFLAPIWLTLAVIRAFTRSSVRWR